MRTYKRNTTTKNTSAGESESPMGTPLRASGTVNSDPVEGYYMTYQEQLKSPRWQKKRLQILERDEFYCHGCGDKEKQLHVHHLFYLKDVKLWDYPDEFYITLCDECHKEIHKETEQLFRDCAAYLYNTNFIGNPNDYIRALRLACRISPAYSIAFQSYIIDNEDV